jgi:uncharacterized delta-60 repeat protein
MSTVERLKNTMKVATVAAVFFVPCSAIAEPGELDTTYGGNGLTIASYSSSSDNRAFDIAVAGDGSSYVVGRCLRAVEGYGHCVSRFSPAGQIDSAFAGGAGQLYLANSPDEYRIIFAPSGDLLVAHNCGGACVSRISPSGVLDTSFGVSGVARVEYRDPIRSRLGDVFIDASGRVMVSAVCEVSYETNRFCLARFSANGQADATYGTNGFRSITMPDELRIYKSDRSVSSGDGGRVFAAVCYSDADGGGERICGAKINAAGTDANDFSAQTIGGFVLAPSAPRQHWFSYHSSYRPTTGFGASVMRDRLGRYLIAASCIETSYQPCLYRLLSNGRIDASFGVSGVSTINVGEGDDILQASLIDDDSILWAGTCYPPGVPIAPTQSRVCTGKVLPSGYLDTTYGDQGVRRELLPIGAPWAAFGGIAVFGQASDGSVIGAGTFSNPFEYDIRVATAKLKSFANESATCALNADKNLVTHAGTDVLLVTRFLLGFQGEALTSGAIGQNATRTADEIVTYLDLLKNDPERKLDLDGDGLSLAMTDGLLMLRAMLGLSGDALTVGAMGQMSAAFPTLRTPQEILQWIETTHGVACLP